MAEVRSKTRTAQVASHVPGRLRLKLHPRHRDKDTMEGIRSKLAAREGINDVRLNPACGSVTVHYDHDRHKMSGILGVCRTFRKKCRDEHILLHIGVST